MRGKKEPTNYVCLEIIIIIVVDLVGEKEETNPQHPSYDRRL